MSRVDNITEKNIREFTPDNTIYISRIDSGYQLIHLCQFVKFERGMVYGRVISTEPNPELHSGKVGTEVKARLLKCYLYGKTDGWAAHAHWFNSEGTIKKRSPVAP